MGTTRSDASVRFGLVGTGFWARHVHARGVVGHPDAELVAVWGRDADKAGTLASEHDAEAFTNLDAMLESVDALAFAVPPDVQAPLAVRAARAGKHLLLEKPIPLDVSSADEIADAVTDAGVA